MRESSRTTAVISWVILAAVAGLVLYIRVTMLGLPFERDEGEFAVMGRMILDGIPPYGEAYNLKPPGIYLAYAFVMKFFGESPAGVHIGLLLVNFGCALFIYLIVSGIRGQMTAAVSSAAFLALSVMPKVLGLSAHATHFVLLPALAGMCLILRQAGPRVSRLELMGAGILMGVSFLMKQPGIFFILLGGVMIALAGRDRGSKGSPSPEGRGVSRIGADKGRRWSGLSWYSIGVAIPIGLTLAWLWMAGVFDRFWFWVVTYALSYGSGIGLAEGLDIGWSIGSSIVQPSFGIWLFAAYGFYGLMRRPESRSERILIIAFVAASVLAVAMGFHFRRHYFVLLLPAVAMLFGLGLGNIHSLLRANARSMRLAVPVTALAAILAIAQTFYAGAHVYFTPETDRASREMFGANPFVESPLIGTMIAAMTRAGERVAVVGSEPQIYFYADRRPATGYLYSYSLVEAQPYAAVMRAEMTGEIERARPPVIVYVNHPTSWLLRPESDLSIFNWFDAYRSREGYTLAGIVEVISDEETVSLWGEEARRYRPRTRNYIEILRRPTP